MSKKIIATNAEQYHFGDGFVGVVAIEKVGRIYFAANAKGNSFGLDYKVSKFQDNPNSVLDEYIKTYNLIATLADQEKSELEKSIEAFSDSYEKITEISDEHKDMTTRLIDVAKKILIIFGYDFKNIIPELQRDLMEKRKGCDLGYNTVREILLRGSAFFNDIQADNQPYSEKVEYCKEKIEKIRALMEIDTQLSSQLEQEYRKIAVMFSV